MSLAATTYLSTLTAGAAICSIKLLSIHFLTTRSRVMSQFLASDADSKIPKPIINFFTTMLCAFGNDFGGRDFVERCERIGKNCAENEPFFFLLALLYGLTVNADDAFAISIIRFFIGSRVIHTAAYLLYPWGSQTGLRAFAFVAGVAAHMSLAVRALMMLHW